MKTSFAFLLLTMVGISFSQERNDTARDQQMYQLAKTDLKKFAEEVSSGGGSEIEKADKIIKWLARNFDWTATDYRQRTIQEIIDRKGGNCNELAMVAREALKKLNFRMRQVREINLHREDSSRGARARQIVAEKGKRYSVFGRRHNDHVWLEIYDSAAQEWFPADPSMGVVGQEWLSARVGFGTRFTLNPISKDMVTPVSIFAVDEEGNISIKRTHHYLVNGFSDLYQDKLRVLPSWKTWVRQIDALEDKSLGAFHGQLNLQHYETLFDDLAITYENLKKEYQNAQ